MDTFDLRKFLAENRQKQNLKEESSGNTQVFKAMLNATGDTYYNVKTGNISPAQWFRSALGIIRNNEKVGRPTGVTGRALLANPDIEEWEVTIVASNLSKEEAIAKRDELRQSDPKAATGRLGVSGRNLGGNTRKVQIPKADSITLGGKVYISALALQKNPDLAKRLKPNLDKVSQNIPGKGSYIGINSPNVERV